MHSLRQYFLIFSCNLLLLSILFSHASSQAFASHQVYNAADGPCNQDACNTRTLYVQYWAEWKCASDNEPCPKNQALGGSLTRGPRWFSTKIDEQTCSNPTSNECNAAACSVNAPDSNLCGPGASTPCKCGGGGICKHNDHGPQQACAENYSQSTNGTCVLGICGYTCNTSTGQCVEKGFGSGEGQNQFDCANSGYPLEGGGACRIPTPTFTPTPTPLQCNDTCVSGSNVCKSGLECESTVFGPKCVNTGCAGHPSCGPCPTATPTPTPASGLCGQSCIVKNGGPTTNTCSGNTILYVQTQGYNPGECGTTCIACPAGQGPDGNKCTCVAATPTPASNVVCGSTCSIQSGPTNSNLCTGNTYLYIQTEGYTGGQCATTCLNCPSGSVPNSTRCGCQPANATPTPSGGGSGTCSPNTCSSYCNNCTSGYTCPI